MEHGDFDDKGQRFASLVSRYATPLAITVVALGLALSPPRSPQREICAFLLVFGLVFNVAIARLLARGGGTWLLRLRLWTNFGSNIVLVTFMGPYWTPIWLIMTLTPMATAIYGSRKSTIIAAVGTSIALLAIHSTRGYNFRLEWGQQIAYALYITLVSLMVNELSTTVRPRA